MNHRREARMTTTHSTPSPSTQLSSPLESRWSAHLQQEALRILTQASLILAGAMLFGLIIDAFLMDDPASFGITVIALPLQAALCVGCAVCLRYWPFAGRHPYWVSGAFGTLFMMVIGYSLGEMGGMDRPFFYVVYSIPCVGLGVPGALPTRVAYSLIMPIGFLLAFFGMHPEHLLISHAYVVWVHLVFMTTALTFFGHVHHKKSYELFLLRSAALEKSHALAQDKAELTEEVETQTRNFVAVTDRAERVRIEERIDLARILHDDMGQLIVSARAGIHNLEKTAYGEGNMPLKGLRSIVENIERSARDVVGALRDDDLPFEVAVEDLVEMYRALDDVDIDIQFDCREWEPDPSTRQLCLSTVQEGITNVIKHADASHVDVSIVRRAGSVTVLVSDDGKGMPSGDGLRAGFGIAGLRERAAKARGVLTHEPGESGGTRVRVCVPLDRS